MKSRTIAVAFTAESVTAARRVQRETKAVVLVDAKGRTIEKLALTEWPEVNVVQEQPEAAAAVARRSKKKPAARRRR